MDLPFTRFYIFRPSDFLYERGAFIEEKLIFRVRETELIPTDDIGNGRGRIEPFKIGWPAIRPFKRTSVPRDDDWTTDYRTWGKSEATFPIRDCYSIQGSVSFENYVGSSLRYGSGQNSVIWTSAPACIAQHKKMRIARNIRIEFSYLRAIV
ncbi:MAG: hypothetical protein METHP_00471 [Methanoregula sp. SKADARSKE-2]|nr:MAG: hypothetical protein METHP_00471 [Methanoregula sp. SKADARSKE-2]